MIDDTFGKEINCENRNHFAYYLFLTSANAVEIKRELIFCLLSLFNIVCLQKAYFDIEKLSSDRNDAEEALREAYRDANDVLDALPNTHPFHKYAETIIQRVRGLKSWKLFYLLECFSQFCVVFFLFCTSKLLAKRIMF